MAKLSEITGRHQCDRCKSEFDTKDVVLKPATNNITIMTGYYVVDSEDVIQKVTCASEGDRTLHCPKCDQVHLFGFNKA